MRAPVARYRGHVPDEPSDTEAPRPDEPADTRATADAAARRDEPADTRTAPQEDAAEQDEPVFAPGDMIATARRRHGAAGAIVAAGMLGLDQVLGRKPREEAPVVVSAPTEPVDVDEDGITVAVDDDTAVVAPPLPRRPPAAADADSRRRRRR